MLYVVFSSRLGCFVVWFILLDERNCEVQAQDSSFDCSEPACFMSNMLYLDVVFEIGDYYSDIFCFHCLSEVGISDTICRRCRGNISTTDNIALRHRELQCNCVRGRVPYSTKVCDRCGREYEKVDFYTPVVNLGITNSLELWLALHKSFVQMLYSGTVCMIACNIVWIHHCKRKRRVTENEQ